MVVDYVRYFSVLLLLVLANPLYAAEGVDQGKKIFQTNCLACHQSDGHGAAPALINADFLSIASDAFLFDSINDGRMDAGMPPWGWLGEQKIRAVIAYLRTQSTLPNRSKAINAQPVAQGSVQRGTMLFGDICLTCHGIQGQGYADGNTGTHIGDASFLRVASDGFIREVIRNGRRGTAMRGFVGPAAMAALSDQEIEDIIVFLRSLSAKKQEKSL
ncbi:MAG: c-type cytochrome [Mariprofundales bacterium]